MVILTEQQSSSSTPLSEEEIMATVLGKRSSYVKGMGYGPRPSESRKGRYSQEYVRSLENQLEEQRQENKKIAEKTNMLEQKMEQQREEYEQRFSQVNEILERFSQQRKVCILLCVTYD